MPTPSETNEKKKPPTPQDIVNYMKDVWSKDADTIKAAGGYGDYNPVALYKKGFYINHILGDLNIQ